VLVFVQVAAFGQAVLLPEDEIIPLLSRLKNTEQPSEYIEGNNQLTAYVNGPFTYGMSDKDLDKYYNLDALSRIMFSAVTLRLVEQGKLALDDQVPGLIPDILEEIPFRRIITVRDLLSGTAGFAVPTWYLETKPDFNKIHTDDFAPYRIQVRGAGQMPHDDPVAVAILVKLLEKISGTALETLLEQEFLRPLGLSAQDLRWSKAKNIFSPVLAVEGSGKLVIELTRLLIRNRTTTGRYLSPDTYRLLTYTPSWRLHPLAPTQVLSLEQSYIAGNPILRLAHHKSDWAIHAFPDQGVAFITKGVSPIRLKTVINDIATSFFPNGDGNPEQHLANKLQEPKFLSGIYVREHHPTASLRRRLHAIQHDTVMINRLKDGNLFFQTLDTADTKNIIFFQKESAYHYRNPEAPEASDAYLTFAPARAGGYFRYQGQTYRHIGLLGNAELVINPVIWLSLLMLSAAIYWRKHIKGQKLAVQIRRMGMFSAIGTLLLLSGLAFEFFYWSEALYYSHQPIYIFMWRMLINLGLMAVLTIPMFTLSITKRKLIPNGVIGIFMNMHIILLTAASLLLFFITVAWGIAGEFWPY
jgi:hypothetical protein